MSVASRISFVGAALLTAALLLAACGDSRSEDEAVAATIFAYIDAVLSGEGKLACEWLTRPQARAVLEGATVKIPELKARSCADALSKLSKHLTPEVAAALAKVLVTNVHAKDGRATAELVGGMTIVRLTYRGNQWLISGGLNLWGARHRPAPDSQKSTASSPAHAICLRWLLIMGREIETIRP